MLNKLTLSPTTIPPLEVTFTNGGPMFIKLKTLFVALCVCSCMFVLCACESTPEPVVLSSGSWPQDTIDLVTTVTPEDLLLLDTFSQLQSADFSGSTCYDEIITWANSHTNVSVKYNVNLPNGKEVSADVESLDLSDMDAQNLDATVSLFSYLPKLSSVKLPNDISSEQFQSVAAVYPQLELNFSGTVAGIQISPETTSLDLSKHTVEQLEELMPWLTLMPAINEIELGNDDGRLSWESISALAAVYPDAVLNYSFELYGKSFTLADTNMNLYCIPIDDEGALVKLVTSCMRNLEYLDMDSCGVSGEAMAEIRDNLPNTKVVWRIWFGDEYSVRTDVEKILASNPGIGGEITGENSADLKYCTEVKYLDLGHNSYLNDISFVSYMPNLEVAIFAMANWSDCSPLADCPKLEYLEMQTSSLNDLRPLAEMKNLKHLNICYCFALTDITPLYNLTQLERLWIGRLTPIPKAQVEEFKSLVPNCEVNTTTTDPTEGGWRRSYDAGGFLVSHPRYELLGDQFGYIYGNGAYAYHFNDPLCP